MCVFNLYLFSILPHEDIFPILLIQPLLKSVTLVLHRVPLKCFECELAMRLSLEPNDALAVALFSWFLVLHSGGGRERG